MAVIKICNHVLSTNYGKVEAREKFEEILTAYLENSDPDVGFDLHIFIENFLENSNDFDHISDIDEDEPDIEYSEEQIDEFIDRILSDSDDEDNYSFKDESEDSDEE